MRTHRSTVDVLGPWSLARSKRFWEGFAPNGLDEEPEPVIRTTFIVEQDWSSAYAEVRQDDHRAQLTVRGAGDLDAAAAQVARFLSLDIDARTWPEVGARDPVIGELQHRYSGLRPCGFHSPYEAAAWAVLSQRVSMRQGAALRRDLTESWGDHGAFPAPSALLGADLSLPGRKVEYLRAVAEAALDGRLDGRKLRDLTTDDALQSLREILGIGPFGAELILIRGAHAPDVLPHHENRLETEIRERYGAERTSDDIAEAWRPFRSWAALHLRLAQDERLNPHRHR